MRPNKYAYAVVAACEDGREYLCERNGVLYWTSDYAKRYTRERALQLAEDAEKHQASLKGERFMFGVKTVHWNIRQTRGKHRAWVRYREKTQRQEDALFARMYSR